VLEASWAETKRLSDSKAIPLQWVQVGDNYHLALVDGPFTITCVLPTDESNADTAQFVAGYKAAGNRVVPQKSTALANPEDYRFRGTATTWTECPAGQTTNIDITPSATEDRWVSGGFIVHTGANPGDTVSFKVVHPLVGVVETYVPSWLLPPGTGSQQIEVYPARIPAGIILRVSYTNRGATAAHCGVNYLLHRRGTGS
jgi:hypothetical protein